MDPSELGRKGGNASARSRNGLGPEVLDDDLRERARSRLRDMLDSDDEKTQLSAAKSLFSYGATPPIDGRPTGGPPASLEALDNWRLIRDKLEAHGIVGYVPGSAAEAERLDELRAENNALRKRVAELEEKSE